MIEGKFLFYLDDLSEAYVIRNQVFQKELGIKEEVDQDGLDREAAHVIVLNGKKPVATGRLLFSNNIFKIGRVAVLIEERGKCYGDFAVRMLVDKAFSLGAKEIEIHSMCSAIPFYEKIGFVCDGKEFEEAGIQHIRMILMVDKMCKKCCK